MERGELTNTLKIKRNVLNKNYACLLYTSTAMNKELFEAAEIAKFNPKELGEYWESLKNFRDWYSAVSYTHLLL